MMQLIVFGKSEVKSIVHDVGPGKIEMKQEGIEILVNLKIPETRKQVKKHCFD